MIPIEKRQEIIKSLLKTIKSDVEDCRANPELMLDYLGNMLCCKKQIEKELNNIIADLYRESMEVEAC